MGGGVSHSPGPQRGLNAALDTCGSGETRRSRIRDTGSHDVLVLDHCIRLTIRLDGRIRSGLSDRLSGAWSFERESALVFLVPGR